MRCRIVLSIVTLLVLARDARADHGELSRRIKEGKALLKPMKIGVSRIGGDNALLAVWKPGEKKVKAVKVRSGRSRTKGFEVKLVRQNGVNSHYDVVEPEGWIVVALKTNVRSKATVSGKTCWKKVKGKKRRKTRCPEHSVPAVYVPYCEKLDTDEMVAEGRAYLEGLIERAAARLDRLEVSSRLRDDAWVTETVSPRILLTIFIIEHFDPAWWEAEGTEKVVRRVLVTVGANQEDAYDYAVSEASAGGLAQFIAGTYAAVREEYAEAKLIRGFIDGMRDHRNAAMAQACLVDREQSRLAEAWPEGHALLVSRGEIELGAWIAAAYNGGPNRAIPALKNHPDSWDAPGNGLAAQTQTYVSEFRSVYRHLFPDGSPSE
jgi:hypothetical protein